MDGYKHYIRTDTAGEIILGFSTAFDTPQDGDICILEDGPRHFHEVWPEPLINERGQFRYKWNGQRVERSQEELDAELAARPPAPPTEFEKLNQDIGYLRERDALMQDDNSIMLDALIAGGLIT